MAVSLVAPALILPIAAALVLAVRRLPDSLAMAVDAVPLVVFGGGVLLGFLTRRHRLVLSMVVLASAEAALVNFNGRAVSDAVALLLPLNLAVIAWLGDEVSLAGRGAALFGMALLQAGAVALLQRPALASYAASLEHPLVAADLSIWTALSQLAVLAFALGLGLALVRFLAGGHPLAAGAAWALVASFLALDGTGGGPARIHFAAAGLLLIAGACAEPRRWAHVDDQTGLPARLELNKALRRLPRRYALARVEIDDFPSFREAHGAEAARRMLRLVAGALSKVGGRGRPFYLGEHTFAVVFRRASEPAAAQHLAVVQKAVEAASLDVTVSEPRRAGGAARAGSVKRTVSVTINVGVAESEGAGADPYAVLRAAEHALERAKQSALRPVSA
jgi:GGDEF domain-containing protein